MGVKYSSFPGGCASGDDIGAQDFYNHKGLAILLGIDWVILASGIFLVLTSVRTRKAAKNGELVTEGIYGMIRHLEYVGHMFIMISLILLSQFWLSVLTKDKPPQALL